MGPTVGSDVSSYPPPIDVDQPPRSALTFPFFFKITARGHRSPHPRSRTPRIYRILAQGWLSRLSRMAQRTHCSQSTWRRRHYGSTLAGRRLGACPHQDPVVSLAGNVFTGGLEEAVFDVHLGKITNPAARPGSPVAGVIIRLLFSLPFSFENFESCFDRFFFPPDGPPFRAAVLIKYAEWLLEPG